MNLGAPRRRAAQGASWIATLFSVAVLVGCNRKATIQDGSEVKLHYTLSVDGQTVDSSKTSQPLAFTVGSGQIIPGLEEQIRGLSPGDHRNIVVTPDQAYGPVNAQAIQKVPRKNFQGAGDIKVGATVTAQNEGRMLQAKVTEVTKDHITIDLNHPMAGKTLNFEIEVLEVAPGAGTTTGGKSS